MVSAHITMPLFVDLERASNPTGTLSIVFRRSQDRRILRLVMSVWDDACIAAVKKRWHEAANGTASPAFSGAATGQLRRQSGGARMGRNGLLTCAEHANIVKHMAKMIQVRNVPDVVHRTLKARAALAGMSLSDFLLAEIRQLADRPSLEELRERLHRRDPVKLKGSAAQAVREERGAR